MVLSGIWVNYTAVALLNCPQASNLLRDAGSPPVSTFHTLIERTAENRSPFRRSMHGTANKLRQAGRLILIDGPVAEYAWAAPQLLASTGQYCAAAATGPTLQGVLAHRHTVLAVMK